MSSTNRWPGPFLYLLLVALTITLDLASKSAMVWLLEGGARTITLLPWLDLRLAYNRGISFSLFEAEHAGHVTTLVVIASLAAIGFAIVGLLAAASSERVSYLLISGGAAGNVIDRAANHAVTDFISFHVGQWHWPSFNIADVAITLGVATLLGSSFGLFQRKSPLK